MGGCAIRSRRTFWSWARGESQQAERFRYLDMDSAGFNEAYYLAVPKTN